MPMPMLESVHENWHVITFHISIKMFMDFESLFFLKYTILMWC